jgi:bifunctional UDP-N-acetylglucosamine pyrophosphorylase/glucosamine-1-phosphate N-acetyltransferase
VVRVQHRREGDQLPETGESDMGLFALPSQSFFGLLPRYADNVAAGAATGERNFLPFIAWVNRDRDVVTFPAVDEMEAVGVNTPDDLRAVETYLAAREGTRP